MIRVVLLFLIITAIIWAGILGFQKMSGAQAMNLTKGLFYATISSSVAVALMFILVELF